MSDTNLPMIGIQDTDLHLRRRRAWNRGLGPNAIREYEEIVVARAKQLVKRLEQQEGEVILGDWINMFS